MLRRCELGTVLLVLVTGTAKANEAPPSSAAKLEIREDRRTTRHRLIIPKKLLKSARTVASLDEDAHDGNRMRTVFAGIALSLAAVCLIFVFMRKKGGAAKTATGLFAAVAGLFAAQTATADLPPPQANIVHTWKRVAQQNVDIEISDQGDKVVLILGTYRRYRGQPKPDRPRPTVPESSAAPGKK